MAGALVREENPVYDDDLVVVKCSKAKGAQKRKIEETDSEIENASKAPATPVLLIKQNKKNIKRSVVGSGVETRSTTKLKN